MAKIGEKLWKNRLSLMGFIPLPMGCRMEAVAPAFGGTTSGQPELKLGSVMLPIAPLNFWAAF